MLEFESLEARLLLSSEDVALALHFSTGSATFRGDLSGVNFQDNIDIVAPKGAVLATASAEGFWSPMLTYYDASGSEVSPEYTGSDYLARLEIPSEDDSFWPNQLYVRSAHSLSGLETYDLSLQSAPGKTSDIKRYVQDGIRQVQQHYEQFGFAAYPTFGSTLTSSGFNGSFGALRDTGQSVGDSFTSSKGTFTRGSWLNSITVTSAGSVQALRVTVTLEAGSAGDMVIYLATASGRAATINQSGGGQQEVGSIDVDGVSDTVFVLLEERNAGAATFTIDIDSIASQVAPPKSGADGFVTRIQGLGGTAEYSKSTLEAVFYFHEVNPFPRVYSESDWGGENYWFQTSDGTVWSFWHGGAVHDRGNGVHLWTLTNLTEAVGLPSGMLAGSLSGTITSWRAFNVVGVNSQGHLVTYWWSPESGERQFGINANGWSLTDLTESATWPAGGIHSVTSPTSTRRVASSAGPAERLEITAASALAPSTSCLFWFDANAPADGWRVQIV